METLFEGDPAELGKAISLGKTATNPNQGNVPFLLGHLLTTVNDDLYRYKMEEVAAGITSIAALTTQGDTIAGYNIDAVNNDDDSHDFNDAFVWPRGPWPWARPWRLPGTPQ